MKFPSVLPRLVHVCCEHLAAIQQYISLTIHTLFASRQGGRDSRSKSQRICLLEEARPVRMYVCQQLCGQSLSARSWAIVTVSNMKRCDGLRRSDVLSLSKWSRLTISRFERPSELVETRCRHLSISIIKKA